VPNDTKQNFPMWPLYLKAIRLLLSTPSLWLRILFPLITFLAVSFVSIVLLLVFALYPQQQLFVPHVPLWLAWFFAIVLVLMESLLLILVFSLLLRTSQDLVFDYVLRKECPYINTEAPGVESASIGSQVSQLVAYVGTFPIALVPVIGPPLYVLCNGYVQGPMQHRRYFRMKGWTQEQADLFVQHHRKGYTALGFCTSAMEVLPVINFIGVYLNAIVSALYAVELERQFQSRDVH
jgi:hypothetical protein